MGFNGSRRESIPRYGSSSCTGKRIENVGEMDWQQYWFEQNKIVFPGYFSYALQVCSLLLSYLFNLNGNYYWAHMNNATLSISIPTVSLKIIVECQLIFSCFCPFAFENRWILGFVGGPMIMIKSSNCSIDGGVGVGGSSWRKWS